jgi:hypothetical protein
VSPLTAALLYRLPWQESLLISLELALILVSFLLTGLTLMGTKSARNIKMRIGGLAGEGLTLELFGSAAALNALFPIGILFAIRGGPFLLRSAMLSATLAVLGIIYFWQIQRQVWPSAA